MKIVYSPKYEVDLGAHPFDTKIYRLIKEKLQQNFPQVEFVEPQKNMLEYVYSVHTKKYVDKILNLNLSFEEILKLEIPLSNQIVESFLTCVSGTILAAELSLEQKFGIHLGGGFHHAYPDHGEGFCIFNDIACAIKYLQKNYNIKKIAVVDCDVHQGNGTAKIFENDKDVFTFSIHQAEIYPFPKEKSSLDIEVPTGTTDKEYLKLLEEGLNEVKKFSPEVVFYQAGVDIYENDQLAQLKITKDGIKQRDLIVKNFFNDIPIVITLGGGYAYNIKDTVELHYNTIEIFITN